VYAVGKTVCIAVDTSAQEKLSSDEKKLDFLLLLYRIFAEYMSIRLRLTNDELVKAKAEVKRLKKLKGKEGKTRILTRTIIR